MLLTYVARQKIIYETESGGKIRAAEAWRARRAVPKLGAIPEAEEIVAGLGAEARAKTEVAEDLWNAALLVALAVKKGNVAKEANGGRATYTYCHESWRGGEKAKSVPRISEEDGSRGGGNGEGSQAESRGSGPG